MISILRLAYQAARVEVEHWLHPTPAGAPKSNVDALVGMERELMPTGGRCYFCAKHPRAEGERYMCEACRDDRARWRREASLPRVTT